MHKVQLYLELIVVIHFLCY